MFVESGEGHLIDRTPANRRGEEISGTAFTIRSENDVGFLADLQLVGERRKRTRTDRSHKGVSGKQSAVSVPAQRYATCYPLTAHCLPLTFDWSSHHPFGSTTTCFGFDFPDCSVTRVSRPSTFTG